MVRTRSLLGGTCVAKNPPVLPYPSTSVTLELYRGPILVINVPMLIRRRRAGVITLTRGVRRFPKLAPGLPLPLQRASQLPVVVVHVPYALLDLPLVYNEAMKQRNMEERLTVLVLVCLTTIIITAPAVTHFLGLPFIPSLYLFFRDTECITPPSL